jgi:NAD(P)-dependent dehydrogenase (short-subunit alcohol dehydrogenase family)
MSIQSKSRRRPRLKKNGLLLTQEPIPPFSKQHQESPGFESRLNPQPRFKALKYKAAGKLKGKVALITGGDSGIGRAVATLFAREGAHVAISYLPAEEADARKTQRVVRCYGRRCLLLSGDLASGSTCDFVVEQTVEAFGKLDILVTNAAHQARKKSLGMISDEEFEYTFQTNLYAYFRLARAALRFMQAGSAIIATSSETGTFGSKNLPDYAATKGAINAFTKSLAMLLIEIKIRVNAVAPGPVWTPLNPSDPGITPGRIAQFGKSNPMGRPAQPEEVAPAYVFLASEADSSFITGIILPVMGGETSGS